MPARHRVAIVGASARALYAFARPLLEDFKATHELVGVVDVNPRRIAVLNEELGTSLPGFDSFDELVRRTRPDTAVIASVDSTHADYVEAALARGVGVVCEKPLCIDEDQCRRIAAAQRKRPDVRAATAHNYRYAAHTYRIKELLDEGAIGTVRSISFRELLDHRHGSSYFRRWNRCKKNSGGLLIHKASHCFDLMNWWVNSRARTVTATGSLTAYGPKASPFPGFKAERCSECPRAQECPQYVDLTRDTLRSKLYFQSREPGSYTPDLCVFADEIDAEDHAVVSYDYDNGVRVGFELCAYATWEGVDIAVEGSTGRIEYVARHSTAALATTAQHGVEQSLGHSLRLWRFEKLPETVAVKQGEGGHGGADPVMLRDLFPTGDGHTPGRARATLDQGIQAVLIGAAANRSIAERRPIDVQSLLG